MKYLYLLLLTLPLLTHTYPAETVAEDKNISLDDVTVDGELAASDKDSHLQKRSGSGDYTTHLKQGFLASLGQASAGIASSSSGGSSGGGYGGYKSYGGDGHHGNSVDYDPWSLKKSVLNTIFQAVKAITGGVTALKGQLIKGSGYALSASGTLVAASGDKVTDVGKYIINSATSKLHPIPSGGGGGQHPFSKFASLSGASSGGSSGGGGGKHTSGPVVHTESITSYEIPNGHSSYGPPSKPPTYSSATHQYLPPSGSGGYTGGGAGFSGGHVAFEAPSSNYLPTAYGPDAAASNGQEFNIYGRHQKLSDDEARKAAVQLQEILSMLPSGKTEYTASKTVLLDTSSTGGGNYGNSPTGGDNVDFSTYGLPNDLGPLESLSHTEQITAAYGTKSPHDLYHQMQKQKQTAEEAYIEKHPNEGYNYKPNDGYNNKPNEGYNNKPNDGYNYKPPYQNDNSNSGYKYDNYHAASGGNKNALQDLGPIIAALEVAKHKQPAQTQVSYAVEKNVHKIPTNNGPSQYLPPAVQKTKYIYYPPTPAKYEYHQTQNQYNSRPAPPPYNGPYKVKRHAAVDARKTKPKTRSSATYFRPQDFDNSDALMYHNPLLGNF